jgi:hypothetical protein
VKHRGSLLIVLALTGCSFERSGTAAGGGDDDDTPLPPAVGGCSAPANLAGDVVLCLEFEDALPMKLALDGSGLNHDAQVTAVEGVSRTAPDNVAEQAVQLTGASRLHIDDTPDLDLVDEVTVEMFVAMDQATTGRQYMFDNGGQYSMSHGNYGEVECGTNSLAMTVHSGPMATIIDGDWHHVACTYDRHQLRVYVDGSLADCKDGNKPLTATSGGTTIGARTDGVERFHGAIDDVRVYSRALQPQEICSAAGKSTCVSMCPPRPGRGGEH